MKNIILLSAIACITVSVNAQTTYFSQNFNSSTDLGDYHGSPMSQHKFDNIATSGNTTVEIFNSKLRINKKPHITSPTAVNSRVGITRSTLFGGMPANGAKLLRYSMEVTMSNNATELDNAGFVFFFLGTAFAGVDAPASTTRHSFLSILAGKNPGEFRVRVNSTNYTSSVLTGTKNIVAYINNSGSSQDYLAPTGGSVTLGNDLLNIYVIDENNQSSLLLGNVPAASADNNIRNLKIASDVSFEATLDIDNIMLQEETVLPVSLTSFTGKKDGEAVKLNWNTASEQNNSHFELLRSGDEKIFTKIGSVKGKGNSLIQNSYTYVDISPLAGVNYYRLTQVDFDGTRTTHPELVAVKSLAKSNGVKIVLTPDNQLMLSIYSQNTTNGTLMISDLQGRKLYDRKLSLEKGYNTIPVENINLPNGLFIANLGVDGKEYSIKLNK